MRAGDTLWSLSHSTPQHGLRWVRLAELNHIRSPYTIYPHERLMQ